MFYCRHISYVPTGDEDYTELTDTSVIFTPGVSSQTVTLSTLQDAILEEDETLIAQLTVSSNNIDTSRIDLVVSEATVTIVEETGMSSTSYAQNLCRMALYSS